MNLNDTPVKQLDDVLIRWHNWSAAEKFGAGYPAETSYCRMYRVSRQYDDDNGALDAGIEGRLMQAVDAAIQALDRLERMALSIDARNLATGCAVWGSAALPSGEELVTLMAEARLRLREALEEAGLW
jgi:hypothetical protein